MTVLIGCALCAGVRSWDEGWRLSLGLAAAPALVLTLGGVTLPESPNSLIERGMLDRGKEVLRRIRGCQDVEAEFEDMCEVGAPPLTTPALPLSPHPLFSLNAFHAMGRAMRCLGHVCEV